MHEYGGQTGDWENDRICLEEWALSRGAVSTTNTWFVCGNGSLLFDPAAMKLGKGS